MANPKIIINSTVLLHELEMHPTYHDLKFDHTLQGAPNEVLIGAYRVWVEKKDFEPFTITGEQVRKLVQVLKQLGEQPIVLEWDGQWVRLKEVIITT